MENIKCFRTHLAVWHKRLMTIRVSMFEEQMFEGK
jgi:hypothetical protein